MQRNYENNITVNNGSYVTLLTAHILIFFLYLYERTFLYYREDQFKIIPSGCVYLWTFTGSCYVG